MLAHIQDEAELMMPLYRERAGPSALMVKRGAIKRGTQFGTQKCVGRSVEAGVDTGWILLSNFLHGRGLGFKSPRAYHYSQYLSPYKCVFRYAKIRH